MREKLHVKLLQKENQAPRFHLTLHRRASRRLHHFHGIFVSQGWEIALVWLRRKQPKNLLLVKENFRTQCAQFMTSFCLVSGAQIVLTKFIFSCFGSLTAPLLSRQSKSIAYDCYNLCAQQDAGLPKFFRICFRRCQSTNQSTNLKRFLGFH